MKSIAIFFLLGFSFLNSPLGKSQSPLFPLPENPSLKERLVWGGSGSLWFGNTLSFEILPLIGYRLNDRFSVMAGPIYSYYKSYISNYSTSVYGARGLARFFVTDMLFLQAENNFLNYKVTNTPITKNDNLIMFGGGFARGYGGSISIMYIANLPPNTPFAPLMYRFDFIFPLKFNSNS